MAELQKFNNECIRAHNSLRTAHEAAPLVYSTVLAAAAQQYAEKLANIRQMMHCSEDEKGAHIGENLAMISKQIKNYRYSGLGATVAWYSEIKDYDFDSEKQTTSKPTGHFTQVVWRGSNEAGFGRASFESGDSITWYVVGRYQPAGNMVGDYKRNVIPFVGYHDWSDVPTVQDYLEELHHWEHTDARRHVLDQYICQIKSKLRGADTTYTVTETFTDQYGSQYTGTKDSSEDPTEIARPEYVYGNNCLVNDDTFSNHSNESLSDDDFDEELILESIGCQEERNFVEDVLKRHNHYRQQHGVSPLKLDKNLCEMALDWSSSMSTDRSIGFSNYSYRNMEIGENISLKTNPLNDRSGTKLVDNWYEENKHFNFQREPNNFDEIGHFSQVVWQESQKIGIAIIQAENKKDHYISCFYYPSGNVEGQFQSNVLPADSY